MVIAVVGTQIGVRLSGRLKGEYLRVALALMILGVAIRLALGLVIPPADLYSLGAGGGP